MDKAINAKLIISILVAFYCAGLDSYAEGKKENSRLGNAVVYPYVPKLNLTFDWVFVHIPTVTVDRSGKAVITFKTVAPTPKSKVYYGLYLPNQKLKIPQYRFVSIENLDKKNTLHSVTIDLKLLENPKYDICDFKQNGGVVCYRIEVCNFTNKDKIEFYDGRFRVDRKYNQLPCIIEGPFVDCVTHTSAVISWTSDSPTQGMVEINNKTYYQKSRAVYHEFVINGLSPNKIYKYNVFCDLIKDFKTYHFKTAPQAKNSNFVFAFMSDSREGVGGESREYGGINHHVLKSFMIDAYNKSADLILFAGDLINGYTTSIQDFRMQLRTWKKVSELVGSYIPIYEGIGNHDVTIDLYGKIAFDKAGNDSSEAIFAKEFVNPDKSYPKREHKTAPSYKENVYYFDYGNTRFIVFNTNYWWCNYPEDFGGNLEGYVMDNQVEWIKKVLDDAERNINIDHIFLFAHSPAFPNGGHLWGAQWYGGGIAGKVKNYDFLGKPLDRSCIIERRDKLWEVISQHAKVVAVFFGDEHSYHRTLINNKTPVYLDGSTNPKFQHPVWHIVSGGAGAPYYALKKSPWSKFVRSSYAGKHYCLIKVNGKKVSLEVTNETDELIDKCLLKPHFSHEIKASVIPRQYSIYHYTL